MRSSKSWACTGTSSIWCGCSSLPFSIFGEATHGTGSRTCRRTTTPDKALSRGLGMAVCPEHLLLSRRLLWSPWIPQMVSHPPVYDVEARLDCRGLHAYGLGAAGPDVCHSGPASVGVGVCGHHGVRIELHAFHSDFIFWGGDLEHFPAKWEPVRRRKCDNAKEAR